MDPVTLALAKQYTDQKMGDGVWHQGETPPSPSLGHQGDYYLGTDTGEIWRKEAEWIFVGRIQTNTIDGGGPE